MKSWKIKMLNIICSSIKKPMLFKERLTKYVYDVYSENYKTFLK